MEQSKRFDLPSGAALVVTMAPFGDAWGLMQATMRALKGMSLSREDLGKDFATLQMAVLLTPKLLDRVLEFASSEEVEKRVFACAQRALYVPKGSPIEMPGIRVDRGLLDDPEHGLSAREDWAQIVIRLMEVNCKPFLARALSGLLSPAEAASASRTPGAR